MLNCKACSETENAVERFLDHKLVLIRLDLLFHVEDIV
jgi:hypothetical protein